MSQVSLYLCFHIFFLIFLALQVIRLRRKHRIGVGSGGNTELALANGVFANYVEYTPFIFLIAFGLVYTEASLWLIHLCLGMFTLGRILHWFGYSRNIGFSFGRFTGMILSFAALLIGSISLVFISLVR